MPANALSIEDRRFTKFNATEESSGRIDINGEYTVTIKNGGFLPVPGVTFNVNSMTIPDTEVEFVAQKSSSAGTIGPGSSKDVTVEFNISGPASDLRSATYGACGGDKVEMKTDENAAGLLLAVATNTVVEIASPSPKCSFPQEPTPGPQPPEAPEPPEEQPPEEPEPPEEPPEQPPEEPEPPEQEPPEDDEPQPEEVELIIDDMSSEQRDGETIIEVVVSTEGIQSDNRSLDVQIVDDESNILASDSKTYSYQADYDESEFTFDRLTFEDRTNVRADVNLTEPEQLYENETITVEATPGVGGGGGGGGGTEEFSWQVDDATAVDDGADVTVSTTGVSGGETADADIRLVDADTNEELGAAQESQSGGFDGYTFEFRDLGIQTGQQVEARVDANLLDPEPAYDSATVFIAGDSAEGFERDSGVLSMDKAADKVTDSWE